MNIIITIPAYNEENTIGKVISEIKSVMDETKYNYKISVVDDGSKDKTSEIARKAGAKVFKHKRNMGLTKTFQTEIERCLELKADVIVHTDADGQYPAKYIPVLIGGVEEGYDLVLGSRFLKDKHFSPVKDITNRVFAGALSSMVGRKITDSTTGFRAFSAKLAREINFISSFTYTQEQIIRASKQGFKIAETPIQARRTRKSRLFKSPFEYAIRAWINIFRIYRDYNPLRFFGSLGASLVLMGMTIGGWVLYKVATVGNSGGIPKVVLSALLILVGLQVILFGFLADMLRHD